MAVFCRISPNSVALGAYYVKVVDDTPILSLTEMHCKRMQFLAVIIYGNIHRESLPAIVTKTKCAVLCMVAELLVYMLTIVLLLATLNIIIW